MLSYREAVSTMHCALEKRMDLNVNERQKIRHYHAKSTENKKKEEEECQITIFYFTRCIHKLCYYSDGIQSFDWKLSIEHNGGV